MGLDMYLTAVLDVSPEKQEELLKLFPEVDSMESVHTEVGYWRKAEAIHYWFVEHVQYGNDDCRIYNVCADDLITLLEGVDNVLEKKQSLEEVFPECTDSDCLVHTKKILEKAMKLAELGWRFQYRSSW